MLVAVEGIDGCGKSTLVKELSNKISCLTTKEPGSPHLPVNQKIREMVLHSKDLTPFQRELMFYTDAVGHKEFIKKQEGLVISDRSIMTHLAYVYGYMKTKMLGTNPDENYSRYILCKTLIRETCADPEAVIYLEGDLPLMKERMQREKDAIESLPSEYFAYVLAQFDDLLIERRLKQKPTLVLSARNSIKHNLDVSLNWLTQLQFS